MTNTPQSTSEWLDSLCDRFADSLRPFKNNSPTAYGIFKSEVEARIAAERAEEQQHGDLELREELKQVYDILHSGLDDITEIRAVRKYVNARLAALTQPNTKQGDAE